MAFLRDNCAFEVHLPFCAESFDYSSELNLFAVLEHQTVYVWNPETKKTTAKFDIEWDGVGDVSFLPGRYIAASGGEANHGSDVTIFSLDKKDPVLVVFEGAEAGQLALTPDKNLLAAGLQSLLVSEVRLDLENKKVVEYKDIWNVDDDHELMGIAAFCCSSNYTVCCSIFEDDSFSCVDVKFSVNGEVSLTNKQTISYCMINGEEESFGEVIGLAHDGENVIVAADENIIVLESVREGSPAHVIVSSSIRYKQPCENYLLPGRIRLNNKNQLMICDGGRVIKIYDYKRPNCLQGLCRYQINKSLKQHGEKNVEHLPIPRSLKDYLLYKV